MEKEYLKKIMSLLLAAVVAFGTFSAGAVSVNAKSSSWKLWIPKPVWTGTMNLVKVNRESPWAEATVKSAKSSDESVLSIIESTSNGETVYYMKGKASGKAEITVKYIKPSGKKATIKKTVTVKKYPKQIKSLQVNGKDVNISKHKFSCSKKTSKKTVSIKMALKKNWKISSIYAARTKDNENYNKFNISKKSLAKGTAIEFPKKYKEMFVIVKMKNGKDTISYTFYFERKK